MKNQQTQHIVINAVLFQCCWFLAIFSEWYWAVMPLLLMILHNYLISPRKLNELKTVAVIAFSGITIDTLFKVSGIHSFGDVLLLTERSVPIWLCVLWVGFALTVNHSLNWLVKKTPLFIVGCAIAGPMSYSAGRANGVIDFSNQSLALISIEWIAIALITIYLVRPQALNKFMVRRAVL
ncbi:DUF2878 domain-containing protein [Alkalimarinus alittae]|uniref:DUF2878 domain-containing protein n=1 Tax=Alkalimarinus alittae TaxID=2961619 RepID=A0ABY6N6N3_9ALTE|nr:DUF2878 domain-containing protein [Alkalimarinus alittae]UZE97773.1 DUF2878 domain-containing protein [Alkalimarinus alittae]